MAAAQKILLVDDEQDFLDFYLEVLAKLPSRPEIQACKSGEQALALLATQPFALLICDLQMPHMDGLELVSLVRRGYPKLRIVAVTALLDQPYRARAYALGVDLFWQKPTNNFEIRVFLDCIESLLGRADGQPQTGIRNRSIQEVLRWECMAERSSKVKLFTRRGEGTVWIEHGEIIDAVVGALSGKEALWDVLSCGTAEYQALPLEPRPRTIYEPYRTLLSAPPVGQQESPPIPVQGKPEPVKAEPAPAQAQPAPPLPPAVTPFPEIPAELSGTGQLATWMVKSTRAFRILGEQLSAGRLKQLEGLGPDRHVTVSVNGDLTVCAGFHRSADVDQVRKTLQQIVQKWSS
jgi:CheY-like chemotaxis protein